MIETVTGRVLLHSLGSPHRIYRANIHPKKGPISSFHGVFQCISPFESMHNQAPWYFNYAFLETSIANQYHFQCLFRGINSSRRLGALRFMSLTVYLAYIAVFPLAAWGGCARGDPPRTAEAEEGGGGGGLCGGLLGGGRRR